MTDITGRLADDELLRASRSTESRHWQITIRRNGELTLHLEQPSLTADRLVTDAGFWWPQ